MPTSKRPYPAAFRTEAIELIRIRGTSMPPVARPGLAGETVRLWVRQAALEAGRGWPGALTTAGREEVQRRRREVRTREMAREILRTAAATVAKETW
jgi:transposase